MARIFFMHIAKTAGSSANNFFLSNYDVGKAVIHAEQFTNDFNRDYLLQFQFISGHVNINRFASTDVPKLYDYITFVREPVAQLVSHLKWMKRQSIDVKFKKLIEYNPQIKVLSEKIRNTDMSSPKELQGFFEGLTFHEKPFFDNCQTRYFIHGLGDECVRQPHVNNAIAKMMESFRFVGISEEFDKSIEAITKIYGFNKPQHTIRENVSVMDDLLDINDPDIQVILKDVTKFDRQLYYIALQRFEQQYNNLDIKS